MEHTNEEQKRSRTKEETPSAASATPSKNDSIPAREEAVLRFWKDESIFQKSLEQTEGNEPYVFYDGPPFATGLPHYGHLLQGTIKDVIPRYQTMRGRFVRRQWGWDCHGLPIENIIEKELGFRVKKDIEEYGIEKFNQKARESVLRYDEEWRAIVPRMGRFVDMENDYKTMDSSYSESVWWAFKTLYDKKLIYEGFKSMHICPRCETTLAASEVAQGYKDIKDISVYVKFELKDEPGTFLLAWTTTPWTLPGNVAVAVHPDVEYVRIKYRGPTMMSGTIENGVSETRKVNISPGTYILSKEIFWKNIQSNSGLMEIRWLLGLDPDQLKSDCIEYVNNPKGFFDKYSDKVVVIKGKELIGKAYKPLFDYYTNDKNLENRENAWKVVGADFVTIDSGTGIVHEAPAFGEEDMELAKRLKLPMIQHVGMDGRIKKEVTDFAGLQAKPKDDHTSTDVAVIKVLAAKGVLFAKEKIEHSYPHCWRCDTPLLNYAASSWFVNVTQLKPRLIAENKEINWIPENVRDGRFGKWLEGARDWAISRSRYWGAPLPVWKCNKCGKVDALGSVAELKEKVGARNNYIVMRHGEADSNVRGVVSYKPEDDIHLTEKGRTAVKATAAKLKDAGIDLIITSPVLRTRETAEIVAEALGISKADILVDPRIAEVNTGDFSGCAIETYRSYFMSTLEKFTKPTPNGENLAQMKTRIAEFMYEIDAKYEGKKILLVTHEYGTWMLDAVSRGSTNEEASWLRVEGGDDYIDFAEAHPFHFVHIPHNNNFELDLHRPFIDHVEYHCSCGLGTMSRIPEVFDCWFESGSMPYAQFHYMGDETTREGKLFMKNFPADFIAEAVDQTRGWFYTMLILSVGLFDRAAYKSVITTGLILAEDGQKMSKKLKNYPDPLLLAQKYGADAVRFYMLNSPVVRGEELRFATSGVDEIFKKMTLRIDNIRSFYEMYAAGKTVPSEAPKSTHMLDRWILARWYETHAEVTHHLDTHELDKATRPIMPFVDDLSTWYLRRSRDRFKSEDVADRAFAVETTGWILQQLAKLVAPFMPFLADDLYRRLSLEGQKQSVHLESWPSIGVAPSSILEEMEEARKVVTRALEIRAKAGIKVRQPLSSLTAPKLSDAMKAIVSDEVNVKQVLEGKEVELDTTITPELKEEGDMRDLVRTIQDLRKKAELDPSDRVVLTVPGELEALLKKYQGEIMGTVGATSYIKGEELAVARA